MYTCSSVVLDKFLIHVTCECTCNVCLYSFAVE